MDTTRSQVAFEAARSRLPGGVNSPARACASVGADPVFIVRGEGAWVEDVDGNRYRDYTLAFGPMILGHGHPEVTAAVVEAAQHGLSYGAPTLGETALAETICGALPGMDRLRLVSSGTEATMSAIRAARGFTGRDKIIKLEGNYHGHADYLLVKAGSGLATFGKPSSAGVPPGATADTLVAPHNDLASVEALFEANADQIACIIVEPVVGNMGCVPPDPGYLEGLRELTTRHGALLVLDEVMTGFRVAWGGAQVRYGVQPDLTALGKVIGGGMPIGAYGGREEVMKVVAPDGPVYQAGTNSGNPVAVACGLKTLEILAREGRYERLEALGARLQAGLEGALADAGVPGTVQRVGSMITLFFTDHPVRRVTDIDGAATERFGAFWRAMRDRGVYLPPSQYEAWFLSLAHDEQLIDETVEAAREALSL